MRGKNLTSWVVVLPTATIILLAVRFLPFAYGKPAQVGPTITGGKVDPYTAEVTRRQVEFKQQRILQNMRNQTALNVAYIHNQCINLQSQVYVQHNNLWELFNRIKTLEATVDINISKKVLAQEMRIEALEKKAHEMRIRVLEKKVKKLEKSLMALKRKV